MRSRVIVSAALGGLGLLSALAGPAGAQDAQPTPSPATITPVSTPALGEPAPAAQGAVPAPAAAPAERETAGMEKPGSLPTVAPAGAGTQPEAAPVGPAPASQAAAAPAKPGRPSLDIASAAQKLGPRSGIEKRELDAIVAFYAARNNAPLWVTEKGRSAAAEAVVAEIGQAGDWGLDPAQLDPGLAKAGPGADATPDALAADELRIGQAVLKYARHARGGRFDPTSLTKFLDRQPRLFDPESVLAQVADAKDAAAYLRQLHPKHAQFERLRERYAAMRQATAQVAQLATVPDGPKLLPGARHAHIPLVRARLGLTASGEDTLYDEALANAVKEFQTARGLRPADGSIGNGTRQALNTIAQGNPKKLLANMEQWRWMPDDLGSFYVTVNIPEFMLRVVQDGKVIHQERVIVGKTDTQTPVFSDEMEQVIFHPFWGVPDGIKSNEIQPSLAKGSFGVLAKHNLRIASGGRDIDPASVDWRSADLRRFHVYQPPGGDNVLGVVKFRFPNKHDVYMHDTPTKGLFQTSVRTYSHGCMRVQNPVRLAEIVLAEDKRLASDRVRALAAPGAAPNNQVNLTRRIPVHITYFTATVEDDGKPRYFPDIYGHENRINLAIEGKAHLIAKVPEPKRAEPVATLAETRPSSREWIRNVFNNN